MLLEEILRLEKVDYKKAAYSMTTQFGIYTESREAAIIAGSYVLLRAAENKDIDLSSIDRFIETSGIDDERALFIRSLLSECWAIIRKNAFEYDTDTLKAILINYESTDHFSEFGKTPISLAKLAIRLLDIEEGEKVADLGCGWGTFLKECYKIQPEAEYFGIDINAEAKEIASIRMEVLGANCKIEQKNLLDSEEISKQYDKAFSNYPIGMRWRDTSIFKSRRAQEMMRGTPGLAKVSHADWFFNSVLQQSIRGPWEAIGIMSNGGTWNSTDEVVRKSFLEMGAIKAVIALPEKLFENTGIPTTMIVFSHGNLGTMLVDATEFYSKGRRNNFLTDQDIDRIVECCEKETEYSKFISYEDAADNNFSLNPKRYLHNDREIKNGVPFGSLVKSIKRGSPTSASELDRLSSSKPTDYQYLMLSNIKNGIIDDELPYLAGIDERQEKYCIKNHNLILSKNGAPFKVAVYEDQTNKKILANGNLYIIEVDEEKVNPYYLKAFFESDLGAAALKSIAVGATIPNIGVEDLRRLQIPMASMEKQLEIADKYLALVDEVKLLRRKTEKAVSALSHLFDVSEEG